MKLNKHRINYLINQAVTITGVAPPVSRAEIAVALYDAIPLLEQKPWPPRSNIENMQQLLRKEFPLEVLSELGAREARSSLRPVEGDG